MEPAPPQAVDRPPADAVGKFVRRHFSGARMQVYFDGGLHKTGYVVFDVHGALVHAEGRYNPTAYSTNNVAKLSALVMAVEFLVSAAGRAWTLHAQYVEMLGDS